MEAPVGLPKLGQTWNSVQQVNPTSPDPNPGSYGQSVALEGTPFTFKHLARQANMPGGMRGLLSGQERRALFVRNTSGVTLLPGQAVTWSATHSFRNRRTGALASAANYQMAGIVDYYLPASGVRDGDLFWLFRSGPVEMRGDFAAHTAGNGAIFGATAGNCKDKTSAYAVGTDWGIILATKTPSASDPWVEVDLKIVW